MVKGDPIFDDSLFASGLLRGWGLGPRLFGVWGHGHPLVDNRRVGPKEIPLGLVVPRGDPLHLLDRRLDQRVPVP